MSIKSGGPAFPVSGLLNDEDFNGMTLRDYFAASALQGFIADKDNWTSAVKAAERLGITTESGIAALVFKMADAMLAEREK